MNLRQASWLFALLIVFCARVTGATFTVDQTRADLRFLYDTLQASHYDLFARVPKEVFDREYERARAAIDRPMDELQAYRIFQPLAALAGMGHCNLGLPFNEAYVPYVMKGGTVIPFDLEFAGDRALIWHNYSGRPELAPGTEVESIDGQPVAAKLAGILRFISGDSDYMKRTNVQMTGFPRLYWLAHGETKTYALTLRHADGSTGELAVAAVPALQFEQQAAGNKPVTNSSREFRFIDGVAYLRPGIFLNQQATVDLAAHATFEKGEFIRFLDESFQAIQARRPAALIIDLRGNPGGDNSFSDPLIAYLADRPFRFCSRFDVRTSQVTKDFWAGVADPALAGLKREILAHANGERFAFEMPLVAPRPESERYHGRAYVLVDRFSYSNAVVVAAMIQDYKFGVVVGEPTADVPSTYGAAHQFNLPTTKLAVLYPKALIVRPSGELASSGVQPDHGVTDDVFTAQDEILEKALQLARR